MDRSVVVGFANALRMRYQKANRRDKSTILDQFCATTSLHRKSAIRLLCKPGPVTQTRPGRPRQYDLHLTDLLKQVWQASGQLCSKRLQPFLPELVDQLVEFGHLETDSESRQRLIQLSPATIDRLLKPYRDQNLRRPRTSSRASGPLKSAVPIRTSFEKDTPIGNLEADLVAHCGGSTEGFYIHTLDAIDIATGWTKLVPIWGRYQDRICSAIDSIRRSLPFSIVGLDCDNGGEFINQKLYDYCSQHTIALTRCRPYHKNDQAHVEQRNWFAIRQPIGYDRYSTRKALEQMVKLYDLLELDLNFFQPIRKIVSKERIGAKIKKTYDRAQTPYQRLLASDVLGEDQKRRLRAQYDRLDPIQIKRQIEEETDKLWALRERGRRGEIVHTFPQDPSTPTPTDESDRGGVSAGGDIIGNTIVRQHSPVR